MASVRHAHHLYWMAIASLAIVALDAFASRRAEAVAPPGAVLESSTHVRPGPDAGGAAVRRIPLDLVPVDGIPLSYAERDSIVRFALMLVGSPYYLGGTTPNSGFDCSGLVAYVLAQMNLRLPRRAWEQAQVGDAVERNQLRPGDLLTFGRDSVSHIGIYIGDGKFIHASSVAHRVVVSRLDRPASALIRPLHGARRLLVMGPFPAHATGS